MDRYKANVNMTALWAFSITVVLIACSMIWANVVILGNHDKVKIVEIQIKGAK